MILAVRIDVRKTVRTNGCEREKTDFFVQRGGEKSKFCERVPKGSEQAKAKLVAV